MGREPDVMGREPELPGQTVRPTTSTAANRSPFGDEGRIHWDLAAPGLRENWEAGDHSMHHPYQAGHGRTPSAADSPGAAAVLGGA
jgi:hypothetical protein